MKYLLMFALLGIIWWLWRKPTIHRIALKQIGLSPPRKKWSPALTVLFICLRVKGSSTVTTFIAAKPIGWPHRRERVDGELAIVNLGGQLALVPVFQPLSLGASGAFFWPSSFPMNGHRA